MIKIFLLTFLISNFLLAEDSSTFSDKQELLMKVKTIIQEEESIALAYESFIINKRKLPTTIAELEGNDYLDTTFSDVIDFGFRKKINNRLITSIFKDDKSAQKIYESDLFRNKTYYMDDDTIGIKLEDDFAKHLYFLSSIGEFNLPKCDDTPSKKYCWGKKDTTDEDTIYIYKEDSQTTLLMYYQVDKFKTGPIIINKDAAPYDEDEFNAIPRGALLYDTSAVKYIKTLSSIEVLK